MIVRNSIRENNPWPVKILAYINYYVECYGVSPSDRDIAKALNISSPGVVHYYIEPMEDTFQWIYSHWITSEGNEQRRRKPGTIRLTDLGRQQLVGFEPDSLLQEAFIKLENSFKQETKIEQGRIKSKENSEKSFRNRPAQVIEAGYVILSARLSNRGVARTVKIPVHNVVSASFGAEVYSSDFSVSGLGSDGYLIINQDMLPARLKIHGLFALEVRGDSMIEAGICSGDYVIVRPTEEADNGDMCVVWIDEREATLKYFHREAQRIRLEPANAAIPPMYLGPSHTVTVQGKVVLVVRV